MASITEYELFASFVGKQVDKARLSVLADYYGNGPTAYSDCHQYVVYQGDFCEHPLFQKLFMVTPFLKESWDEAAVDLRIYIYIKNGVIVGGHIFIYQENIKKSLYCPSGYSRTPTQQEIRIVSRILKYISSGK